MKLAIKYILRIRFLPMAFQDSLLNGLPNTASEVGDATNSDRWIPARDVTYFDLSARLLRRLVEMAWMAPGSASSSRMSRGFLEFREPGGLHGSRGPPVPLTSHA